MSRIEELPDDFDESLNLNEAPKLSADDEAVFEEMYYNRFAKKGADKPETNPKSFEEIMQELSQTPLFMNNLDDTADAGMRDFFRALVLLRLKGICRW
jgi:Zn-dependent oligopeptidase